MNYSVLLFQVVKSAHRLQNTTPSTAVTAITGFDLMYVFLRDWYSICKVLDKKKTQIFLIVTICMSFMVSNKQCQSSNRRHKQITVSPNKSLLLQYQFLPVQDFSTVENFKTMICDWRCFYSLCYNNASCGGSDCVSIKLMPVKNKKSSHLIIAERCTSTN